MLKNFFRSFQYAVKGWRYGLRERNMRIHLLVTVGVIFLGLFFSIDWLEWSLVLLCIGMVIATELINTAIEETIDALVETNKTVYPKMGPPKDLLAGAVLIVSLVALIIGLIVFIPHFLTLLHF